MVSNNAGWASNFTDPNYYNKTYHLGPVTDYSAVRSWVLANGLIPGGQTGVNSANYDYVERISAGYAMNTIDLSSRLRLVTGLRFEQTHMNAYGPNARVYCVDQKVNGGDYLDVLPSASLRIGLAKDSGLRLVYGRGISRPNPQDIVQASSVVDTSQSPAVVTIANPNLKAEHADNFDVLFEQYLKTGGLFQAGFFYKYLTDPIVNGQYIAATWPGVPAGTNTLVSQVQNVGTRSRPRP